MSVIRPQLPEDPIEYDPRPAAGAPADDGLGGLAAPLLRARTTAIDTRLLDQPDRLLADYNTRGQRAASELFAILQAARRIRDAVDRVVMPGGDLGTLAARGIFESCGHPRHNDLSRGDRGGRPRLSFLGPHLDDDGLQALLDVVTPPGRPPPTDLLDRWGVLAVDDGAGDAASAAATRCLLETLAAATADAGPPLADRMASIAVRSGWLADLADTLGEAARFTIPDGMVEGGNVFTAAGLLPAAIAGIDVVRLLEGAAAMHRRFCETPAADNPMLLAAAAGISRDSGKTVLIASSNQLEAICRWHGRLVSGRRDSAATAAPEAAAPAVVETRLVVGEPRRDLRSIAAAVPADAAACRAGGAAPIIRLPRIDEHTIGQLLQMQISVATIGRLVADRQVSCGSSTSLADRGRG